VKFLGVKAAKGVSEEIHHNTLDSCNAIVDKAIPLTEVKRLKELIGSENNQLTKLQ
jgi:hypothetical protein